LLERVREGNLDSFFLWSTEWSHILFSILLQSKPLIFGKRITACLPIAQSETFTGKRFLLWLYRMPFICPFSIPSCSYPFCHLGL
jgi:hypothetical protein